MAARPTLTLEGRDPEVVEAFIEESLETLPQLVTWLEAAEAGQEDPQLVSRLFRHLHTLKGTAGFLELGEVASVAHAAENLLDGVREAKRQPSADERRLLLEAVARLRALIAAGGSDGRKGELQSLIGHLWQGREPERPAPGAAPRRAGSVRVELGLLDRLSGLAAELGSLRRQLQAGPDTGALRQLERLSQELGGELGALRLLPLSRALESVPALAADVARRTGKRVRVELEGAEQQVDRAAAEALREPLLHLVRNAVDHGIERPERRSELGKPPEGLLRLRVTQGLNELTLELSDDGAGVDPARVRAAAVSRGLIGAQEAERLSEPECQALLFRPGFSTAGEVTSISGRGVGMDVVRTQVEAAGGSVALESRVGQGTCLRLRLPLRTGRAPALLLRHGGGRSAVLQRHVRAVHYYPAEMTARLRSSNKWPRVMPVGSESLEVLRLSAPLTALPAGSCVVVLEEAGERFGLWVDDVDDAQELERVQRVSALGAQYEASALLPDGSPVLVLDPLALRRAAAAQTAAVRAAS
jgi:two-component system chemotaxis sensor kinase CheA